MLILGRKCSTPLSRTIFLFRKFLYRKAHWSLLPFAVVGQNMCLLKVVEIQAEIHPYFLFNNAYLKRAMHMKKWHRPNT